MPQLELPGLPAGARRTTGSVERWCRARGLVRLVGADEVGRGPLAGPVVAAAVALPARHRIQGLDDSKALTAVAREGLERLIRARAEALAVVELPAEEIDRTDILRASLRAMGLAVLETMRTLGTPDMVLVDGPASLPLAVPQRPVVSGDHLSANIAAASIVAKVYRDRLMAAYDACWPVYGFAGHKGYGTAEHLAALRRHGPCAIHRRSFRGVVPSA